MKILCCFFALCFAVSATAQNVGIGTATPTERLHVNGNINVAGTIKANGVDGQANQVLMKNSSGTLAWGDVTEFKNVALFTAPGAGSTWTVPAGVTRIAVELWGAGGGANSLAGGGGGGYLRGILTATPGGTLNITVGTGGTPASSANTDATYGGYSIVFDGSITLNAGGGGPAYALFATEISPGSGGGGYATPGTFRNYVFERAEEGQPSMLEFMQAGTSTFYEITSGGRGGNAANTGNTGGTGSYRISLVGAVSSIRYSDNAVGAVPGGGGGAGFQVSNGANSGGGSYGGNGLVIIHY